MKNTIYIMLILLLPMFSSGQVPSEGHIYQHPYGITSAGQNAGKGSYGSTIFGYNANYKGGGYSNSIFGASAGYQNSGTGVVFIGSGAGRVNRSSYNTFVGTSSGFKNQYGSNNTFLGNQSGYQNLYGSQNVFIGTYAARNNQYGSHNTVLGYYAGYNLYSGQRNVYLGALSGGSGSDNVFIGYQAGYGVTESHRLYIENSNAKVPLIYGEFDTNKVGVNTNSVPTGYTFAVNGKTIAEEVKVKLYASWPDYVFDKTYHLPSLQEVEKHITEKGHLHNIPTAETVKENGGFLLGEMHVKLLEKVEELTLYAIAQEKEISSQKAKMLQVQEKNETLEVRLAKLEAQINALLKE